MSLRIAVAFTLASLSLLAFGHAPEPRSNGTRPTATAGSVPTAGATAAPGSMSLQAASTALAQSVDAACATTCRQEHDRQIVRANEKLASRGYYVGLASADCPAPWDNPHSDCAESYWACRARCGLYDTACSRPCFDALQSCCHAVELANEKHGLERCLAECPAASAAPDPALEQLYGRLDELVQKNQEVLSAAFVAYPENSVDLDNLRRQAVFDEVAAEITKTSAAFALVSGGAGRLWLVKPDGTRVRVPPELAANLRSGGPSVGRRDFDRLTQAPLALSPQDATGVSDMAQMGQLGAEFKAGEVQYYPGAGGWPVGVMRRYRASSEHSTIHGTINGGGDFI